MTALGHIQTKFGAVFKLVSWSVTPSRADVSCELLGSGLGTAAITYFGDEDRIEWMTENMIQPVM
jgi:hypothetical protein